MRWIHHPVTRILLVLVTLCVVIAALILRSAFYIPEEALHPPTPSTSESATALTNLLAVKVQWELLRRAHQYSGIQQPFEFKVSDRDLNTVLRTQYEGQVSEYLPRNLPLRNPTIRFDASGIQVTGLVDERGRTFFITIRGSLKVISAEALQLDPREVQVGNWKLPGFLQTRALSELNRRASRSTIPTPGPVKEIRTDPGWLIVRG